MDRPLTRGCNMNSRPHRSTRSAFTLVELMVVVGIIVLLIAIVLPAVNAARIRAKVAATQAAVTSISTGLETLRAETQIGGAYPPSYSDAASGTVVSPHDNTPIASPLAANPGEGVSGASLVAWALAGADLLGPPGFRDLDGNGLWSDNTGNAASGLYELCGNSDPRGPEGQPVHKRYGPYVDISKMQFPERLSGSPAQFVLPLDSRPVLRSMCFLDAFGQPILYYRANASAPNWVGSAPTASPGIYNLADNITITGVGVKKGIDLGIGPVAQFAGLGYVAPSQIGSQEPPINTLGRMIWDPNVTATFRPYRADSYLLLSPGPDGRFGNADDVANFPVNQ